MCDAELARRMLPLLLLLFAACTHETQQDADSCGFLSCVAADKQRRPFCGTDNVTYPSRCHLLQLQCRGEAQAVAVQHRGRCRGTAGQPCLQADRSLFVPACLEDGTFAPVQCHTDTGYCWCVTPAGMPVPNSSTRNARPHCPRGKSNTRRRSSPRGRKQKKGCGREDRSTFNKNLIKIFSTEHSRAVRAAAAAAGAADSRAVLDWKFSAMDLDGDGVLDKAEYRDLRRLVKKAVKPKRCAKLLTKLCDADHDARISRSEWADCLTLDFDLMQESVTILTAREPSIEDDFSSRREEPEGNDCHSDRRMALEDQKMNNSQFYIPECMPDGRYQIVQCYKSTGYCWCVHEDNGKPIPGTSRKDQDPKCDSIPVTPKIMSGCSEVRKQAFLKDLMDLMKKKMLAASANKTATAEKSNTTAIPIREVWQVSAEEQAATWIFLMLDKNKNKVLERKEWKNFRSFVSSKPQLRRCGKRLPRHCDVNNDRKISITEWLNCVIAQRTNTLSASPVSSSRRRGLNPLQMYLKGED